MRNFIYIAIVANCFQSLFAQENNYFSRPGITVGVGQSFRDGDEQYFAGFHVSVKRLHLGISAGIRPPAPETVNLSVNADYDVWSRGTNRITVNMYGGFYARYDSYLFDEYYWKNGIGIAFDRLFLNHFLIGTQYNIIGVYYGTRRDNFVAQSRTPGPFEAGEVRIRCSILFGRVNSGHPRHRRIRRRDFD